MQTETNRDVTRVLFRAFHRLHHGGFASSVDLIVFFFLHGSEKTRGFSLILLQVTLFHDIFHHNEENLYSLIGESFSLINML